MKSYLSHRNPVFAKHGMVATTEPQAAQAGLDILKKGGNAIDAAIATAAALTVLEPTSNGIGGDNFAIIYHDGKLDGLNSSGFAPEKLSIDALHHQGLTEMPRFGVSPITVPGAVKGWLSLSKKYGKLSLIECLKPAINYARNGFVVGTTVSKYWKAAHEIYKKHLTHPMYQPWFDTFTKDGRTPEAGEIWYLPYHANTLEEIGLSEGMSFYQGNLAHQITDYIETYDGFLSLSDLKSFESEWVSPIFTSYRGVDIYELPPNGQGAIALLGLNILEHKKFLKKESTETYHYQLEAMKLAFADGLSYLADPNDMVIKVEDLLSKSYAKKRFSLIKDFAEVPQVGQPNSSGTVYLATADQEGNMVSLIQSNYMGFGSGIVIPQTGIAMHNRGHNFSFDPKSPNVLSPLKRPYHTIIPGFMMKKNAFMGPFGVMGGFMQPQGHLQVLMNLIDFQLNPQEALDAPRWQWIKDKEIHVEPDFNKHIIKALQKKGHEIKVIDELGSFGRGQIILFDEQKKTYQGGTEKRADGTIASY